MYKRQSVDSACEALSKFKSVKRRLECIFEVDGIRIFDDFAHHPTAIRKSIQALSSTLDEGRIIAIMEPRSNTMRMGVHSEVLSDAFLDADLVYFFQPNDLNWNIKEHVSQLGDRCQIFKDVDKIAEHVCSNIRTNDQIIIMSNGAFGGIHKKIAERLN